MCASTLGGKRLGSPKQIFFSKILSKIFSNLLFSSSKFFSFLFLFFFFLWLFVCVCVFVFLLVCCQAFCMNVATGVPGRQALAGRETVEDAGGTAGIVG